MPTRPSIWLLVTALMWHGAAGAAEKADTHFAKGTDLRIEGKTKEAVEALKKAVSLMPGNADALVQLGAALEDVSKWEEAAHAYRRALELDPSNRAAQRNLEHIEASRALNEPPKLVNTAREALLQRGLHALEQGDADRALAVFRLCRGLLQNDPRPLFYSAVVMERHGKISDCIALYEQTIAAHPRFAPAWTNLLVVLLASGDREAAKKRAQDAIRALPDDRSIRFLAELAATNSPVRSEPNRVELLTNRAKVP